MKYWLLWLCLASLTACSSVPEKQSVRASASNQHGFVLNGRVAVKQDEKHFSGGVRWTHEFSNDEILLLAPLGQTVARIQRDAQGVTLTSAEAQHHAQDVETLTQQVLGWRLPLSGLQTWVLAQPSHTAFSVQRDPQGRLSTLQQDGWNIRYTRYASDAADSLPTRLLLQRDDLEIQLLIDEWLTP